ncbi:MAG TPA: hypothetical protein PKC99_06195 [Anaerolineales bacterium]|nr:hypothetical protein [Anaerolineales bacterium]
MSSVYPGSLDSFTAKTDGVDYNLAAHINDLQDAVVAIETELGLDPAGSEADVKTRLDNMTVDVGAIIHAATDKATPVDADELGLWDSVASALKKLTWANLKARLKTHFDTLYLSLSGGTVTGALNLGGNAIVSHTAVILDDSVTSFVVGSSSHFAFLLSCSFGGSEYGWGRCNRANGSIVNCTQTCFCGVMESLKTCLSSFVNISIGTSFPA